MTPVCILNVIKDVPMTLSFTFVFTLSYVKHKIYIKKSISELNKFNNLE